VKVYEENNSLTDSECHNSLAAYAAWRDGDRPLATRCAALAFALHHLRQVCAHAPTAARLSTLARVPWEWGARSESVAALQRLLQIVQGGETQIAEQFWPASTRFDTIASGSEPSIWFCAAAAEQLERSFSFSSIFGGASPNLAWLCRQSFCPIEIERRRVLAAARGGHWPKVPAWLCIATPDHLNASVWRTGQVPGTIFDL
jgi:hypothetical protein